MRSTRKFYKNRTAFLAAMLIVAIFAQIPVLSQTPVDKAAQARKLANDATALIGDHTAESYRQAIAKWEQALGLYRELGDDFSIKDMLIMLAFSNDHLGLIYYKQHQDQPALDSYNRASTYYRNLGEKSGEGDVLNNIAKIYDDAGEKQKALSFYEQTLTIFRSLGDGRRTARALNNIGLVYDDLDDKDRSIASYTQALALQRAAGDKSGEAGTLGNIGSLYWGLHNYLAALDYHNQALSIQRTIDDKAGLATTLNNIGLDFSSLKETGRAIESYQLALTTDKAAGSKTGQARTLNNIGSVYRQTGDDQKALAYYSQALDTARSIGDEHLESAALVNIGAIYAQDVKTRPRALDHYNQALAILRFDGNKSGEATVLHDLMVVRDEMNQPQAAIVYGKQAVNLLQQIRASIQHFDRDTQTRYLENSASTYRKLAELLIAAGRLIEARAVLDLLKVQEYKEFTRGAENDATIPYGQTEASVISTIEHLTDLERERAELQRLLGSVGELSAEQNKRLEQLNVDIAAANKAFDAALGSLGKEQSSASARVDEIKGGKVLQSALTELGERTNSGVVALYTVLGAENEKGTPARSPNDKAAKKFGWVVMVTENRYTAYPIDMKDLEETVFQFRSALSSDKYDPQPLAEKIYNAIFRQTSPKLKKTLEQDLNEYLGPHKDKTLMWSLDGVLRYIPVAALHDGKQYLATKYLNTLFTKESFVWLMNEYHADWKALGFGVSEKRGNFAELPGVKTELETIVHEPNSQTGILNGSIKLNDNFKKQTFLNIVSGGAFPVVHISSHYSFDVARPDNSFLLAGDGNLTFGELKEQQNLFKKTDLLTLSACDTGVSGNGKEAEGFAYLAQALGAKSVIASLWKVSDEATPELMIRFYKLRAGNPEMTKGEAFRQAQLSLLNGGSLDGASQTPGSGDKRSDPISLDDTKLDLKLYVRDPTKPFAHPHYWAPFVLIGNWR